MPNIPPSSLQINTRRLLLRPLLPEDATALLFIRSNDIVNKYISRPKSISIADANNFLIRIDNLTKNNECFYWAVVLKETNELIGTACFFNIDKKTYRAEIGYELHPDYHRKGIMQEAITEIISFGFKILKFKIIVALVFIENISSIQLLIKNNFLQDKSYKYIKKKDAQNLLVYFLIKNRALQIN